MKKFLLSLIALVACVGINAQTYIWTEDFSSYEADAVPTGGTYNYACTGSGTKVYDENLAGGKSKPEILVGKAPKAGQTGGSFSATIPMGGKTGDMTITFQCNKNIEVQVEGATLGECTKAGNSYSYPVNVTGTKVKITFYNPLTSNARLDDVKFFQGVAKKAAGLSWGKASTTAIIGEENTNIPTLSNTNNLPVTYSSDNTAVATINSEGVVTLVAEGTANISASFAGNSEYEAQTVSYELTVKDPSQMNYNTPETALTAPQANTFVATGENLDKYVYVKGVITEIKSLDVSKYTNAQFYIGETKDATETFYVYNIKYLGGEDFTSNDQIKVGDEVIIYAKLTKYTPKEGDPIYETAPGGQIYSINGTTGISNVTVSADNAAVYNLAGQRINANAKGIVIKGGKKYVNK